MRDPLGPDVIGVPLPANGHAVQAITNGHTIPNGNTTTNGNAPSEAGPSGATFPLVDKDAPVWPSFGAKHHRTEVVKILIQGLQEMGYLQSAILLEKESGFALDPTLDVTDFRKGLLNGDWVTVDRLLDAEGKALESKGPGQGSLQIMTIEHLKEAKFLVAQQKYLELLESGNQQRALNVLRTEVHPLASAASQWPPSLSAAVWPVGTSTVEGHAALDRLGLLSSLLCSGPETLHARSGWAGVEGGTRMRLLDDMRDLIPPSHMLPPHRLANLLTQAQNLQCLGCLYHASETPISLLCDHSCPRSAFPSVTTQILREHSDEVWRVEWSRNGKLLATGGKDRKAIVWSCLDCVAPAAGNHNAGNGTALLKVEHIFDGHENGVSALCWDHLSQYLVTASDCRIRIFDVLERVCISTITKHDYEVSVLSTLADGTAFLSGAMDQTIHCWKFNGDHLWTWPVSIRVLDLAPTPDGRYLLGVGFAWETGHADMDNNSVRLWNGRGSSNVASSGTAASGAIGSGAGGSMATGEGSTSFTSSPPPALEKVQKLMLGDLMTRNIRTVDLRRDVTCVRASADSKYALVNFAPDEIGLYSIDTMRVVQLYAGQRQANGNIIQSCFGGVDNSFVLSGSEDGNVYAWHRNNAQCIGVLTGHEADTVVNAVAWRPECVGQKALFVSAGDDHTVRVWQAPDSAILPASVTDRIDSSSSSSQLKWSPQLKWW